MIEDMHEGKRVKGFSKDEAARISKLLKKKLGPEFISYRPGFNSAKVAYIEGWTAISLANRIFGFNGWSSEIRSTTVDCETVEDARVSLGVSCVVRITLKDGSCREDVGFGSSEGQRSRVVAYEKAKKEAATDALKRAMRQFGNSLGNCCYDKAYIKEVQRVNKINEKALDSNDLFRNNSIQAASQERDNTKDDSLDIDYDLSEHL